jgi:polyferredoxin
VTKQPTKLKWIGWLRRLIQLTFFLLFNAAIFGLPRTTVTVPVLGSLGQAGKTVVYAFGAIQKMLSWPVMPWIPVAAFILSGVLLGRASCGWACPFGFVQDLAAMVREKHLEVSLRTHFQAINIKYGVLAATLLISGTLAVSLAAGGGRDYEAALGVFAGGPFSVLSPADTFFAVIPSMLRTFSTSISMSYILQSGISFETLWDALKSIKPLLYVRLSILATVLGSSFFIERIWCRYFCPVGAFLSLFSRFSFLGLRRNLLLCVKCGECMKSCPMLVRIHDKPWEKILDPECTLCLECTDACSRKAIKPVFP